MISSIRQVFEHDPLLSLRAFTSMYISAGDFLSLMNSSNEHALSFIDGSIVDDSSESATRRRVHLWTVLMMVMKSWRFSASKILHLSWCCTIQEDHGEFLVLVMRVLVMRMVVKMLLRRRKKMK